MIMTKLKMDHVNYVDYPKSEKIRNIFFSIFFRLKFPVEKNILLKNENRPVHMVQIVHFIVNDGELK